MSGGGNSPPTLTVDEPDGSGDTVTVGDNYNIQYDLEDTDDEVTVAFYYDTDGSGYDGIAISGDCSSAPEGTDVTCTWDTTGMTPGSYYIYGITNDGTNPDVTDYSPGQITINAAPSAPLYRSVGTTATALANGTGNALSISGSTATFGNGLSNSIGVGDVIQYDSNGDSTIDALAFIHGRTDSQTYTVKNKDGGMPTAVTGDNDWAIYRAYTSLSNWASQTENSNITEPTEDDVNPSKDLVAANTLMMVACYKDGADTSITTIDGWTTGASNYIRIYTPKEQTEVGTSQRHTGVAGTGYRIAPVDATQQGYNIIHTKAEYTRIEGIEIDGSGLTDSTATRGILVLKGMGIVGDIRIDSCIIHDLATNSGTVNWEGSFGIMDIQEATPYGPPMLITNNIIYNIFNNIDTGHCGGMVIGSRTTSYVYNNTIYNIHNEGPSDGGAAWGILAKAWQSGGGGYAFVIAKNNYVGDVTAPNDPTHKCYEARDDATLTQSYNTVSYTHLTLPTTPYV
jgi:hypothetical protein